MPTTKYRCTNFATCNKALEREEIEIQDGEDPICPEKDCGSRLEPVRIPGRRFPKWVFAVSAAVLVVIGLFVWLAIPATPRPNPDAAEKMLSDFYPQLPAK